MTERPIMTFKVVPYLPTGGWKACSLDGWASGFGDTPRAAYLAMRSGIRRRRRRWGAAIQGQAGAE